MELAVTPHVRLWVDQCGQGVPVVLLHGHTLDSSVFDGLKGRLQGAGMKVVCYDQRGHGRSSSPPSGYWWGDHARDLKALVETLGLAPTHVVGLSKGGGIALEAALRFPALFRSLVLVGPLVPDYPLPQEFFAFFKAFARAIREKGVAAAARELWFQHPLLASVWRQPGVREKLEAMVLRFPAGEYLATERDQPDRTWKVVDRLGEIRLPTLIVRGEEDTPEFSQMADFLVQGIPCCELVVVPASGHLVPLEQPEFLAHCLVAFFNRLRG